jgi:hypothetical protein
MKNLMKLLACWVAFGVCFVVDGMIVRLLHLHLNSSPDQTPESIRLVWLAVAGGLLILGMWPMARGLASSGRSRAAVLASFLFLALGINTLIEGVIYTSAFDGAIASSLLTYVLMALFVGSALGVGFGKAGNPTGFTERRWIAWARRGAVALLAWPMIYFFFGMCIAPIVLPVYQSGLIPGLHIPPVGVILEVQLVRSAIFLAASLPLMALWKGSRRGLWLTLGLAHTVAVGIYGLVAATFMPAVLRITHSVEITCDSFAYAGLLVLLFGAEAASKAAQVRGSQGSELRAL